jgi:hypothetical protein
MNLTHIFRLVRSRLISQLSEWKVLMFQKQGMHHEDWFFVDHYSFCSWYTV